MPRYKELDTPKVERIRKIKKMMATGEWVRGITGEELAKEWGCSVSTVSADAAEASRSLIRDVEEEPGEIRAMLLTLFAHVIKDCEDIAKAVKNDPFQVNAHIHAMRAKTDAITNFCRAYTTMPKAQEKTVVPVAVEQLSTIMKAHGYEVRKSGGLEPLDHYDDKESKKEDDGTDAEPK